MTLRTFVGDRDFYRRLMFLSLPMMVQNAITAFVGMLDNIMVGSLGTESMTGVSVANQLIFVFNLCVFGAMSGAGLFGAQFFGKGDREGVRYTFRFKLISGLLLTGLCMALLFFFGEPLCNLYMKGEGGSLDAAATLSEAKQYLNIMLFGFIPYAVGQCYASTLRETGLAAPPMVAGVVAVCVNVALNYVLIFGHFGLPALGVSGAAIATVISRFVELAVVVIWTHAHTERAPFIRGAFRSLYVPRRLTGQMISKGLPLMLNETAWAVSIALVGQCYSLRGLDVVAAYNISQTYFNVFSVAFKSVGIAVGIMSGQTLGAGQTVRAKEESNRMMAFSVFVSIVTGALYALFAQWIPLLYNTTDTVRSLATALMVLTALFMPIEGWVNASYFILRAGGKSLVTFLFDSGFSWGILVPVTVVLAYWTGTPILLLYTVVQALNVFKCAIGVYLVSKGIWVRNIIDGTDE